MSYEEKVSSVARAALRMIWPEPCLACGKDVGGESGAEAQALVKLGLCRACCRQLKAAPESSCTGCGTNLPALGAGSQRCEACRAEPPAWRHLTWLWLYGPPFDAVILGLKFRRLDYLARPLGRRLASQLEPRRREFDAVVPVPLHRMRYLRRGYDQAALIAGEVAEQLGLPLLHGLRRRRWTSPQSHRDRDERRVNLHRAFIARRVGGRRVLLVDDVMTTGATLESAALALLEGGAVDVDAATVARTPGPDEAEANMS